MARTVKDYACKGSGENLMCDEMIFYLIDLEKKFNVKLYVLSAYRSTLHNDKIGGSKNSYHCKGLAIDFTCPQKEKLVEIANYLKDWNGGFKYYVEQNFIHFDIGPRRRW